MDGQIDGWMDGQLFFNLPSMWLKPRVVGEELSFGQFPNSIQDASSCSMMPLSWKCKIATEILSLHGEPFGMPMA